MYGLLGEPIQTDNGDLYSDYLSSISIVDENRDGCNTDLQRKTFMKVIT